AMRRKMAVMRVLLFLLLLCPAALAAPPAAATMPAAPVLFKPDDTPADQWPAREAEHLKNVRQLTSPALDLDKSGEAYFSPDQRTIIFQACPKGETTYQMFTLRLDERGNAVPDSLKRVSPPAADGSPTACTCGFFRPDGRKIIF